MILLRVSIWLKRDIETQYFLSRVLAKLILLKFLLHWTQFSLYRRKQKFFFLGVWWANRRVFCFGTLWYFYCFFFLSCYLITIPKHINDMEDFCQTHDDVFFSSFFFFLSIFFLWWWFYKCNLWKKQNKNQRKISLLAANGNL